ncbi:MAG TPA: hypothetical protein HA232_04035, partial [Methanocellales archaeon]|nr:hypothetical protein [Methanocellales archaeon]
MAKTIITALFNRNGLVASDGRMLCKYRCCDDDYLGLQAALKDCVALRHRAIPQSNVYEVAAFCLYASEWWRRNYDSGPWKWSTILESIDLDPNYSRVALYEPIRLGLRFWKRKLLTVGDRNAYFVTLACEGGLPLKLIHREEDSHLKRYLRALLREFRVYGGQETNSFELAARIGNHLPRGLQQKQLFQICGELIEQIWRLQSQLIDSTTPVEDLDRKIPKWRDTFPLVVSDDAAHALLNSLMNDAVKISRVQEIRFATILKKTALGYQLERKVQLPSFFDARSLASLLEMPVQNLPYRIQLYQHQMAGISDLLALVTRRTVGDEGRFAIETPSQAPTALQGSAAAESVWLDARSSSINLELRNIKGSLGLSDLPWIFASKDGDTEQWELIGQGSLKTKFSDVLVAVSPDAVLEKENATCEVLSKNAVLGRYLYRVVGPVIVLDNGIRTTICTKSSEEESAHYMLSGEFLSSGTFGSNIYKGLPRITCCLDSGLMMNISGEQIQWKTRNGTDPWKTNLDECFGPVTIRYVSHGDTRFMADIDVVPAGSRITFIPSTAPRVGSIAIKGMQASDYGTMQAETVQVNRQFLSDGCIFEFSSILDPPATIQLYLRWQLGQELTLQAPYPTRGVRFISRDGSILKTD